MFILASINLTNEASKGPTQKETQSGWENELWAG